MLDLDRWVRVVESDHVVEFGGGHSEDEEAVNTCTLSGIDGCCVVVQFILSDE